MSFFVAGSGSQPDENHLKVKFQGFFARPLHFPELTLYLIPTAGSSAWQRTRSCGQNTGLPQSAFRLFLAALHHTYAQSRFDQANLNTKTNPVSKTGRFGCTYCFKGEVLIVKGRKLSSKRISLLFYIYINDLSTENSNALMKAADERDLYKSKTYHHTKAMDFEEGKKKYRMTFSYTKCKVTCSEMTVNHF